MDHDEVHTIDKTPSQSTDEGNISGSAKDKEDAKKMSEAIKARANLNKPAQPPQQSAPQPPAEKQAKAPVAAEKPAEPKEQIGEDDDMYIDNEGNIHYREEP